MCGIAGYVAKKTAGDARKLHTAFLAAAIEMEDRGKDSWGWTDGSTIHKTVQPISHEIDWSFVGKPQVAVHTRQRSSGKVNLENAHPWQYGPIIGMHNGMIYNDRELNRRYNRDCQVDSQHIFMHLDEKREMSDLEGYGAVVFFDQGTLHLGIFNGGSLYLAETAEGFLFASTSAALEHAAIVADLPVDGWYDLKDGSCYIIQEDAVFVSPIKLDVKAHTYTTGLSTRGGFRNLKWFGWENPYGGLGLEEEKGKDSPYATEKYEGFQGRTSDEEPDLSADMDLPINHGLCAFCWEELSDIYYLTCGDDPVCEGCADGMSVEGPYNIMPDAVAEELDEAIPCAWCNAATRSVWLLDGEHLCRKCFSDFAAVGVENPGAGAAEGKVSHAAGAVADHGTLAN